MLLKDFAEGRIESAHTIATYIRRHPAEFEGHTSMVGNRLELDDEAVAILEKVYPFPQPVQVVEDYQTMKELAEARKELNDLKSIMLSNAKVVAQAESNIKLLAVTEAELAERKVELEDAQAEVRNLTAVNAELIADKARLEAMLEAEKCRKLSFWERLTGQKKED